MERKKLRKSGVAMHVEVGGEVYFGPGIGAVMSGDSLSALIKMDDTFRFYKIADDCVKEAVKNYLERIPDSKLRNMKEIKLKMAGRSQDSIVAADIENGLHVRLYTNKEGTGFSGANVFMLER